jgi:hypothetical protein
VSNFRCLGASWEARLAPGVKVLLGVSAAWATRAHERAACGLGRAFSHGVPHRLPVSGGPQRRRRDPVPPTPAPPASARTHAAAGPVSAPPTPPPHPQNNGTGKSSLLVALRLATGALSLSCARDWAAWHPFAEHAADPLVAEVDVCNDGPGAYRPDVYGATIG